nr:retrovirus-related Pol polyprotein from transposon TNT 1-94 [Tanacetum cinerariifolium]
MKNLRIANVSWIGVIPCHGEMTGKDDFDKIDRSFVEAYNKCLELEAELVKKKVIIEQDVFIELSKSYSKLEQHCISLEVDMDTHIDYIKHTQEYADTLREIVKHARALKPLDSDLKSAMKSSTSTSRSQPLGNTKKNKISRTTSKNKMNKVEDHPRSVKSSSNKRNHVSEPVSNANVKHSMLNADSKLICATCNECMFDAIHDLCVLDYVNDVNVCSKPKSFKSSKKEKTWKPTGKIFTIFGYRWLPTRWTFTIDAKRCPLTMITSTIVLPPKETSKTPFTIPNLEIKLYRRKTKVVKSVVQIVLWYLDSGCSKHMTRKCSQLINFVSKFKGTIRFGNDHVVKIMGYGDYQMGNVMVSRVYYVEWLGHNLFFVGQFCDSDLEVAFCKHTCYIRDLEGVDLLKGSRGSFLYTLSLEDMMLSFPIYLLSKASKTNSWLSHRRLSHLNFDYVTTLAKQGLVRGLPKLKFQKDNLCFACAIGKSKKHTHKPKAEDSIQEKLYLLHIDLCGPIRIQSINGRKYILVIVDEYSRFTWVKFLRSKDETPEFVIKFLKMIQVRLNAIVWNIITDNATYFVNQTLRAYYDDVGI